MPRKFTGEFTGQLRKVSQLYKRSQRIAFEQAVVEGPQSVRELLRFAPELIRDVYVTEQALHTHQDINELLIRVDPYTHVLSPEVFARLSTNAQGFLAHINIPDEEPLADVLGKAKLLLCAIELSDPGNLGTIIRSADAMGAEGVILGIGSVEATNPKALRSTAGSFFHIPIIEDELIPAVIEQAHEAGFQVLIADGGGELDLGELSDQAATRAPVGDAVDLRKPTMWLLGNEAHGFTEEQLAWADARVRVPMWGSSESLNVAMATTICLYASAVAQHR